MRLATYNNQRNHPMNEVHFGAVVERVTPTQYKVVGSIPIHEINFFEVHVVFSNFFVLFFYISLIFAAFLSLFFKVTCDEVRPGESKYEGPHAHNNKSSTPRNRDIYRTNVTTIYINEFFHYYH